MMQEVDSVADVSHEHQHHSDQIADQLQEAAGTFVTQASLSAQRHTTPPLSSRDSASPARQFDVLISSPAVSGARETSLGPQSTNTQFGTVPSSYDFSADVLNPSSVQGGGLHQVEVCEELSVTSGYDHSGHSHSGHGHSHTDHGHSHSSHGHSHSDHGHSHSGHVQSSSLMAPPTTGFVPSHGLVAAAPAKVYAMTPGTAQYVSTPATYLPQPDTSADIGLPYGYPSQSPYAQSVETLPPAYTASTVYTQPQYMAGGDVALDTGLDSAGQSGSHKSEGLFGWLSGSSIVNKVLEKTKSSVETMITTLDPGMKDIIYSGGDIDIIVTSIKEVKIAPVRQAFQEVFGRATVNGQASESGIAPQPVGFSAGVRGAEERIDWLRRSGAVHEQQTVVSVENFIAELLPDMWFDLPCLVLRDPPTGASLRVFGGAVPVSSVYVSEAQSSTPADYGLAWSGLSVTVGEMMSQHTPQIDPGDWHYHVTGVSRRHIIYQAARLLAGLYRQHISSLHH